MRANAVLIRWQDGWADAFVEADVRIEMAQGHAGDSAEVIVKAIAELTTYGQGQYEITVGLAPEEPGDAVFGVDLIEGDQVFVDGAWRAIVAFTKSFDDETGLWTTVPQFGTVLDDSTHRIDRTIRNIGGMAAGTSKLARPVASLARPNLRPGQ